MKVHIAIFWGLCDGRADIARNSTIAIECNSEALPSPSRKLLKKTLHLSICSRFIAAVFLLDPPARGLFLCVARIKTRMIGSFEGFSVGPRWFRDITLFRVWLHMSQVGFRNIFVIQSSGQRVQSTSSLHEFSSQSQLCFDRWLTLYVEPELLESSRKNNVSNWQWNKPFLYSQPGLRHILVPQPNMGLIDNLTSIIVEDLYGAQGDLVLE